MTTLLKYFRTGRHSERTQRRERARREQELWNEMGAAALTARDFRRAGRLDEARAMVDHGISRVREIEAVRHGR